MFSKQHVEALLKRARIGQNIDLTIEAEAFIESEIKLSERVIDELYMIGSVVSDEHGSWLLYESRKHKIEEESSPRAFTIQEQALFDAFEELRSKNGTR